MSIILVRHGETALNAARVLQHPATPLGERGLAQAQAVGRRLAALAPAAIVASDMRRAWMTAQAIAASTGLPVGASPLLHERNFGEYRGRSHDSLDHDPIWAESAPMGGESLSGFRQRVARAFAHVVRLRAALDGPLVVVSHGLVIRVILSDLVNLPPGVPAPERLGNTSLSIVGAQAPHTVELIDCTRHLDAGNADDKRAVSGI